MFNIKKLLVLGVWVAVAAAAAPTAADTTAAGDEFWDGRFGPQQYGWTGANDWIADCYADGTDLYVTGYFDAIGGVAANRVAKWDGNVWQPLGGGLNGERPGLPYEIVTYGGDVVLGGRFEHIDGGLPVENIARFDGTGWHELGGGVGGSIHSTQRIEGIHVNGADLYVCGEFEHAGGQLVHDVAKWDGSTWTDLVPGGFQMNGGNSIVYDVTTHGGDVYIGGSFSEIHGVRALGVARLSGGTWYALGAPISFPGSVQAMCFDGGDLYIGGGFSLEVSPGVFISRVARWDGSQWHAVIDPYPTYGSPRSLIFYQGDLIVGGDFEQNSENEPFNSIGKWTSAGWDFMNGGATGRSSTAFFEPSVNTMVEYNGELVAVGAFDAVGDGLAVGNIARWSGNGWLAQGPNNDVRTAVTVGDDIYIGGDFDRAGDVQVSRVARWDGIDWHDVGGGLDGQPSAMVTIGGDVFVAGDFMQAGGVPAQHIASWDGANWHALGSGIDGTVNALATDGTHLYAGGDFLFAGGSLALDVAKWDGSTWTGMNMFGNGPVTALAVRGGDVYAGGSFTQINGQFVLRMARWDGIDWVDVGGGLDDAVVSMSTIGLDLYVSGDFDNNPWGRAVHIARWDGANWHALDDGTINGIDSPARAMTEWNGTLLAVGEFSNTGSVATNRIASWDPALSQWTAFGSGLDAAAHAVATVGHVVYAGGEFARAGGKTSYKFARWDGQATAAHDDRLTAHASLEQNIPNPFNPVTTIKYNVPEMAVVTLRVYDTAGRLVRTLVDGSQGQQAGAHETSWDGRDDRGQRVSSGVYFCQLRAGAYIEARKMVMLK